MPYIKSEEREAIDDAALALARAIAGKGNGVGHLNFAITRLLVYWLKKEKLSYASINAAMGAMDCVSRELYRRVAGSYEDVKRVAHGDVYSELFSRWEK
jgi:hypothetical protein